MSWCSSSGIIVPFSWQNTVVVNLPDSVAVLGRQSNWIVSDSGTGFPSQLLEVEVKFIDFASKHPEKRQQ